MKYISVPKNEPNQQIQIPLDGSSFSLRFYWNMRGGWTFSCADSAGEPLFGLRGVVVGVDYFERVRSDERTPAGSLMFVDLTGQQQTPGYLDLCSGATLSDLQGTCMLVYTAPGELA